MARRRQNGDWLATALGLIFLAGWMFSPDPSPERSAEVRPVEGPDLAPAPKAWVEPSPSRSSPPGSSTPGLATQFARLFPPVFAMVMATAIIAIDANALGRRQIAMALWAISIGAWLLFWFAGGLRCVLEPRKLGRSLLEHQTGPAFLTIVAGTALLGAEFDALKIAQWVIVPLFALSVALWCLLLYGFVAGVSEGRGKPSLETGFSGQWLLIVVATEAIASLGADVLKHAAAPPPSLVYICYSWAVFGVGFYLMIGSVVLYRFFFVPMPPEDLTGPWWIDEGAASNVVFASTKLMMVPGLAIGSFSLKGLLSPLVVVYWADASFWIPLLVLLFAWKHLIRNRKIGYSVRLWSGVFPLGMYAAATLHIEMVFHAEYLHVLGQIFFWLSLVAWALTLIGAIFAALHKMRQAFG